MKKNRRNFIKTLGVIGAGMGVMPLNAATSQSQVPEDGFDSPHLSETNEDTQDTIMTVSILQTTDVHCQIHPHDELYWENDKPVFRKAGGYAHMSSLISKLRKSNPQTFLVDTGDMFQGSELSFKTSGSAFVPILDALKYDLYLPGNWEVIYGKKKMQELLGSLHAPKVCANMYHDLGEGKRGELIFQPYHIWNVAGAKIGFLGYTDPLVPIRQSPNYSKGILYTKPEENLRHYVEVLKKQEKCSFVIILAHLGLSQQIALANAPECEGVDYIMGGDTHERVRKPIQCKYAKVVEPGAFGSFVGKLDLGIVNGKVVSDTYSLIDVNPDKFKADKKLAQLLNDAEKEFKSDINEVIGYSTLPLYRYFVVENTIDTLIVNALKWKFPDVDIALSNGFRFCPPRSTPDHTGHVPITKAYIFDMFPIDSNIKIGNATGKQILEWLEKELNNVFAKDASKRFGGWVVKFDGIEVTFNAYGEMGKRVQAVSIGGKPLDPDKSYSLLACERDGDPSDVLCRMKGVANTKVLPATAHKIITEYIRANSPITPTPPQKVRALDAPATLLSQVSGVEYTFK